MHYPRLPGKRQNAKSKKQYILLFFQIHLLKDVLLDKVKKNPEIQKNKMEYYDKQKK